MDALLCGQSCLTRLEQGRALLKLGSDQCQPWDKTQRNLITSFLFCFVLSTEMINILH